MERNITELIEELKLGKTIEINWIELDIIGYDLDWFYDYEGTPDVVMRYIEVSEGIDGNDMPCLVARVHLDGEPAGMGKDDGLIQSGSGCNTDDFIALWFGAASC